MANPITTLQNELTDKSLEMLVSLMEKSGNRKSSPEVANIRCAIISELHKRDSNKFAKWSNKNTNGKLSPRAFYL